MSSQIQENLGEENILNLQLLSSVQLLENKLVIAGAPVSKFCDESLQRLRSLKISKKKELNELYTYLNSSIDPTRPEGEIPFLIEALKRMGYTASGDFWTQLGKDDILEIYGPNMTQIYRNLNFYKVSAYSLLDLSSYEWYELLERSKVIEELAIQAAMDSSKNDRGCRPLNIPEHIVHQRNQTGYTMSFKSKTNLVKLKNISTLLLDEKNPSGFLVSSSVTVLPEGTNIVGIA